MLTNRRFSTYLPWMLLLFIVVFSFIVYFVGLNRYTAPPGCDYGNYLTQVEILRGNDLRGWGLRHNPVFFVVLDIFLRLFEEFTALKIVASLVFAIISIPFFLLARKLSGNPLVAVICTWLFVFFISNSEMISWGGNPNILGFSFMLVTLFFFVDLMEEPSKKNLLLSGFFLSLVVGTHILVAICLIFSFLIFLIATTWASKGINKVRIKSLFLLILVAIVFSLPYLSFYVSFLTNSSSNMVGITLLSMQIPQLSFDSILAIGEYWAFFVVAIIFVLGLFALSKYVKEEHKNNGLLLCSLFMSPLILALITDHPIRWVYFLPIPLFLCFGIYLRDLFFNTKTSEKTVKLLAICFIAIIGFHTTVMMFYHLRSASEVYQFIGQDEIQALNWIKENTAPNAIFATSGHPKGDIGGGGNSYSWWIEGYCTRVCISSGDLTYYSYKNEQDQVQIANRIFAGTYFAEYDNLRVTEGYPSNSPNPGISAFLDKDYQDMISLNDELHRLYFSPNESEQLSVSGFYSEDKSLNIQYGDTWANITVTYDLPYFELVRSVIMGEEKSSVDVVFQILPKNSSLTLFKVNLWSLFEAALEDCNISNDYGVSLDYNLLDESAQIQISLLETNGKIESARVFFDDPKGSAPVVSYSFEPIHESLYVRIRVFIESSTDNAVDDDALQFYNSYDLIKDLHIDYIVLNRGRQNEFQRFLFDSEHFTEVFQNKEVVIFKVI
ncbi:MAG: hypothetical protein IAX21_03885 [Candidatus Bathyarchaeota archaeon]|nr:MAG: hypothetical protein IAX21_03885 [Candidatus Bathyarchaeota archaeon]